MENVALKFPREKQYASLAVTRVCRKKFDQVMKSEFQLTCQALALNSHPKAALSALLSASVITPDVTLLRLHLTKSIGRTTSTISANVVGCQK